MAIIGTITFLITIICAFFVGKLTERKAWNKLIDQGKIPKPKNSKKNPYAKKEKELSTLGFSFPFLEYYSHENCECYKILNPYTEYEEKIVLCREDEGYHKALNLTLIEAKNTLRNLMI